MKKLSLQELNRVDIQGFKQQEKHPIVLILDNVRSALNVGSAFRTADGFALSQIYLCGITATPPHREILKTAIGATDAVDWTYMKTTKDAVLYCKEQGYTILGAEQTNESISLQDFQVNKNEKYAIVLGNEVKGISNEVLEHLDICLEIPQFGTKHSFNVSVAAGIIVWEVFRGMKWD